MPRELVTPANACTQKRNVTEYNHRATPDRKCIVWEIRVKYFIKFVSNISGIHLIVTKKHNILFNYYILKF